MEKHVTLTGLSKFLENCRNIFRAKDEIITVSDLEESTREALEKATSSYQKPYGGIPKTDLASAVQTSLDNAAQVSDIPFEYGSGDKSAQQRSDAVASGRKSFACSGSTASGEKAFASGADCVASGENSSVEGSHTIAQNHSEHAGGKYNKSNKKTTGTDADKAAGSTIHSIGVGTSAINRKNAVEVMQDGKVYILGVGGYDGTNPEQATDLATILSLIYAGL